MTPPPWPLGPSIAVFVLTAALTVAGGIRLSKTGDMLADRTGLGEALFGSILLGGMISASGIVMSATAALAHQPELAYSNAVGGIAAQTAALGIADLFHRGANLEHAAASLPNVMSTILLITLLLLALLAGLLPDARLLHVHPGSVVIVVSYVYGLRIVQETRARPLWTPTHTPLTVEDEPEAAASRRSTSSLWCEFIGVGLVVALSGWAIARAAESFVVHGGIDASFVGAVLMGVVNALPEAVISIAAVKRGALTLAMAGVLGGNAFDVLNLVVADVALTGASIYHAGGRDELFLTLASLLMTVLLLAGMLRRQARGPGKIGLESVLVLALYFGIIASVSLME